LTLGVYLGWHVHPWPELLALVRHAEALGYDAALVDGDVSLLDRRPEADCLDGWTVTTALLVATARIQVGSLRLVHHWNAARLAQAVATALSIAPGRLRFALSIGDHAADARFGLPALSASQRIAWLAETLDALRALWRGETVTRAGRWVQLERAWIQPVPPGGKVSITVAARRPRMLEVVAAHADVWDVNLPPVPARVREAASQLAAACARRGRDPAQIARSMLLFTRADTTPETALAEFRRFNPWFAEVSDAELLPVLAVGEPARCRERIAGSARELGLAHPVLDLSGLPAARARRLLDALGPANSFVDTRTYTP
jgi:alkanesulfonate monooxygenase SsuD/methylene tetrahydromethanopterin reductase-like flavin-dependent oxidoreductase (luciferase family)